MYIKTMVEENKNLYISYWLLLITLLVALIIIVGGFTRLTDSGLSITKWDLFVGIIPPLSPDRWEELFSLYKKIPEYKLLNSTMTLNEFKVIFWWEYIHRLLGRIIGLAYILPLLYFTFKKMINKRLLIYLYLIFFLILIQGFVGWYMVKSGLTDRTDVSHYRLSIHLVIAFIIFISLLWNFLRFKKNQLIKSPKNIPFNLPIIFTFLILLQIMTGAFVSGLDAGQIYQTWPLMNQNYFPDDSNLIDLTSFKLFETPSLVQFIHRNLAYITLGFFFIILIVVFKNKDFIYFRKISLYIFAALLFQIFLGILTIISGAQILLASMHQIGSIILITTSLILVFKNSKIS